MYSHRGMQHIRNEFIIIFHLHFASDSCYTISYAFIPIHAFHTVHSSVHISSPATLFHTHSYPCFPYSTLLCTFPPLLHYFIRIPIHAFHTVHSSVHISSPSFSCRFHLKLTTLHQKSNINAFLFVFFLLFPDALYQKYVFLENIFCRDFVFIPGNTRKVSLLAVCFSLNPSPNFCVCVFVHACVYACMSVCVCTCLLYSINTKRS